MLELRSVVRGKAGVVLGCACVAALAGCGTSNSSPESTENFSQAPPGRVPHAAPSNAHKEIPTRFGRTVSLPYRSTVIYAKAIGTAVPIEEAGGSNANGHTVGILLGLRNIGTSAWSGSVSRLSKLAVSRDDKPEGVIGSIGASTGPCPGPLIKSRAPVSDKPLSLPPDRTAFECVRFRLPQRENPILFKFAVQPSNYTLAAAEEGEQYGVWALPGTLVDRCRFEPGTVKGHCQGLEAGEDQ
jgi:hypothetical protein